ncbi:MAG: DUF805 domain-containing protein [Bacteroidaceae bacterium]|nr:DUF805 domain-containing protein [Bacteroidaceae bacterium]
MKSMGFVDALKSVLIENYANFKGRARRSEFWYFALAAFLLGLVYSLLLVIFAADAFAVIANGGVPSPDSFGALGILGGLFSLIQLALIVPWLAVSVRRLHDMGKSGKMLLLFLLYFVPFVGFLAALVLPILFIVWYCQDSQPGENQWGANPKE